jgi:hypothetical protein
MKAFLLQSQKILLSDINKVLHVNTFFNYNGQFKRNSYPLIICKIDPANHQCYENGFSSKTSTCPGCDCQNEALCK